MVIELDDDIISPIGGGGEEPLITVYLFDSVYGPIPNEQKEISLQYYSFFYI